MFNLNADSFCNKYDNLPLIPPLMAGLEFMRRPVAVSNESQVDFQQIARIHKQNKWNFELSKIRGFLQNPLHAIVLTDHSERIQWVNQGFVSMTGYRAEEAFRKSPKFLQGSQTPLATRQAIRTKLNEHTVFDGTILNYRKNGEPYLCKVQIEPIFDRNHQIVNYIAFEYEVAA